MPAAIPVVALQLALVVAAPLAAAEGGEPLTPARYLELKLQADAHWRARELTAAAKIYERLVEHHPEDGDTVYRLARCYHGLDRLDEAMPLALAALERGFADEERTAYGLAQAAADRGEVDAALDWLERALAAPLEERPRLKSDESFAAVADDPRFRALAGFPPEGLEDRVGGWRHDLDFFVAEARRLHASPERPAWSDAFGAAVESLAARVAELDDVAVAVELQKIVAGHLGDGHSVVYPMPTERVPFRGLLPLSFYFFSDGLFVVAADEEHREHVGRRVLAIGGRDVAGIERDLAAVVSRDNAQGIRWIGPLYLRSPAMLRAIGYAERLDEVVLTLADGETTEELTLAPAPPRALNEKLSPPPGLASLPRWLARVGDSYWHEPLAELDAVYVQVNQIRDAEDGPSIADFAHQVRDTLAATGVRNLLIDVRHNNGGNNFLHWPLLRLVAWHGLEGAGHRTFVLTGRNTFSACQDFINFLERATDAVFVGEVSSSKPNFTGEDTAVELPWSGLRLSISSRYWQDSYPSDRRPYIPVSMPVEMSSEDWLAGRDPVLEALADFLGGS